uniref:Uncharacterized protein n=1 Tax=Mycobacterium basiliense TaxID=2094119 RepID=A0A3S4FMG0_9MYCO|nr:hypothetical protein [Mycobacterium basiliense]VDM86494.1 hypothetical protein MB901379_00011 [Mycobacterium basiliense]
MPWFSDDDSGRGDGSLGPGVCVPGLYARIREHERVPDPDPRWRYTAAGQRGEPCPDEWLVRSKLLPALERGEPVKLPGWCHHLGRPGFADLGEALPGLAQTIRGMQGEHGKWVLLIAHADDTLVPVTKSR